MSLFNSNACADDFDEGSDSAAFDGSRSVTAPPPRRRSRARAIVQLLRRGHLYAGLLMLPWVILYGITAFLFNHPTAFSDQTTLSFGKFELTGTPMESPPAASEWANAIVAALQERSPDVSYLLLEPSQTCFTRDFAVATVKADGQEINIFFDPAGKGGTIRARPTPRTKAAERAPFAIGREGNAGPRGKGQKGGDSATGDRPASRGGDSLKLEAPLHERIKAAIPSVLEKTGFPQGEISVTSVPDVTFLMQADEKVWKVTCNPQTGVVSGRIPDGDTEQLSTRRFLTRLHLMHGYPFESNARWGWALVVDCMAVIMVFWGFSGLLMWWQIKATRWLGAGVLIVSALLAAAVGLAMHDHLTVLANR